MDMLHRETWFRVKLFGISEAVLIHEGGFVKGMRQVMEHISKSPSRYGKGSIEFDFEPMNQHNTTQENSYEAMLAGLDLGQIELESLEDAAYWERSPMNPDSPKHDPLFVSYMQCHLTSFRDTKTPEDLAILRKHIESNYQSTEWWDGAHKW